MWFRSRLGEPAVSVGGGGSTRGRLTAVTALPSLNCDNFSGKWELDDTRRVQSDSISASAYLGIAAAGYSNDTRLGPGSTWML